MRFRQNTAHNPTRWCGLICVGVIALIGGCQSATEKDWETAAVSGSVTVDGKPLEEGTIRFAPIGGTPGPKTSFDIRSGEFQSDAQHGPSVGTHRIEIESANDQKLAHDDEQALQELKGRHVRRRARPVVPVIYNTQSRLTATVKQDMQPIDFSLRSR